ncbi:MAG: MerR family transcriptional regulator [Candidatus Kapaibacterium sp.]
MTTQKALVKRENGSWVDDPVLVEFFSFMDSEYARKSVERVNEKLYTVKETDLTYRALNHWTELELLEDDREEGKGWRKFSMADLVWIRILTDLRYFGVPIEKLKRVKDSVRVVPEGMELSLFEYYLVCAMTRNDPVYMRVFQYGDAELLFFKEYLQSILGQNPPYARTITPEEFEQEQKEKKSKGSVMVQDEKSGTYHEANKNRSLALFHYVLIDFSLILRGVFQNSNFTPDFGTGYDLTEEEQEFLLMLRTGNYDSLTIRSKGGMIETIESEEVITGQRIADVLKQEDFQNIEIKKRDGKVVRMTRTTLKKLA